ncbi:MAG: ATPase [Clostridia bacterium]|nr:ATPase [Clostridia bacterium]
MDITFTELTKLDKDSYTVIDIRDRDAFNYGHITGAINIPEPEIFAQCASFSKTKQLVICCRSGKVSPVIAEKLRAQGYQALNLVGGYFAWLKDHLLDLSGTKAEEVETSIRKQFRKTIFAKFCRAICEYDLIQPGDKIAVCISGGKDSMLMAKLFQELKRHNKIPFELVFLVMDPGYSPENREIIERNAQMLAIPITIFETDIFENVFKVEKSPCYLCARMRRGHLYHQAQQLGCNKIALGHHYDDVMETILMGMLYGGQIQTMMPKLYSKNFPGMQLIRPMYLIREQDILRWRDENQLSFIQCACKFTDTCTSEGCTADATGSKRKSVKQLIAQLKQNDPQIERNIFRSVENVNLATVITYKDKAGVYHNFKEDYQPKHPNTK